MDEHVSNIGEMINTRKILTEKLKEGYHFQDLGVDRRILFK
jgi:hypothetical protein